MAAHKKSDEKKILEGTFRKDRVQISPAVPEFADVPSPPDHLNKYARYYWAELAEDLVTAGVLRTVDLGAFELMCDAYGLYRESKDAVYYGMNEDGEMEERTLAEYLGKRNSQTAPELTAMNKAHDNFQKLAKEFGMTPVSRNRVDVPPARKAAVDPMEALCEGG